MGETGNDLISRDLSTVKHSFEIIRRKIFIFFPIVVTEIGDKIGNSGQDFLFFCSGHLKPSCTSIAPCGMTPLWPDE